MRMSADDMERASKRVSSCEPTIHSDMSFAVLLLHDEAAHCVSVWVQRRQQECVGRRGEGVGGGRLCELLPALTHAIQPAS